MELRGYRLCDICVLTTQKEQHSSQTIQHSTAGPRTYAPDTQTHSILPHLQFAEKTIQWVGCSISLLVLEALGGQGHSDETPIQGLSHCVNKHCPALGARSESCPHDAGGVVFVSCVG